MIGTVFFKHTHIYLKINNKIKTTSYSQWMKQMLQILNFLQLNKWSKWVWCAGKKKELCSESKKRKLCIRWPLSLLSSTWVVVSMWEKSMPNKRKPTYTAAQILISHSSLFPHHIPLWHIKSRRLRSKTSCDRSNIFICLIRIALLVP